MVHATPVLSTATPFHPPVVPYQPAWGGAVCPCDHINDDVIPDSEFSCTECGQTVFAKKLSDDDADE